ncbi:MAG: metalloregulator ArsR/SmtB family transcription factor [Halobacteriales archaeon]
METDAGRIRRYLEDDRCRVEDPETRIAELAEIRSTVADDRVAEDVAVFSTLGNETRYRLVRALVAAGEKLCVCELNGVVDASESAVSHALSDLRDAGLVTRHKDGRWRKYRATPVATALLSALGGVGKDE